MVAAAAKSVGASDAAVRNTRLLVAMGAIFIIVAVGRIGEIIPGLSILPLVKIALGLAILGLLSQWKNLPVMHPALRSAKNNGVMLVVLVLVSVPFSVWPGPSVVFLYSSLPVIVVAMTLIVKLSGEWAPLRTLLLACALAGGTLSLTALSGYAGGRIEVESMYDTNDLAYVLVTLFPLTVAFVMMARTRNKRLLCIGLACAYVAAVLLTSSRGGLLGLMSSVAVMIFSSHRLHVSDEPEQPGRKRKQPKKRSILLPIIAAAVIGMCVFPLLPTATQERLSSIVNLGNDYNLNPDDDTGRTQIWKRGMTALKERPLGYGVVSFGMVDLTHGGRMLAAHNSVVQITVELGVLAFILFLRMYYLVWRALTRAQNTLKVPDYRDTDHRREQAIICWTLKACLTGCFVSGMFLSMAYANVLWVTMGIAIGCASLIAHKGEAPLAKKKGMPGVRS
jgi:O-antigen ligase